jgi:hypothetical protein
MLAQSDMSTLLPSSFIFRGDDILDFMGNNYLFVADISSICGTTKVAEQGSLRDLRSNSSKMLGFCELGFSYIAGVLPVFTVNESRRRRLCINFNRFF